MHNTRCVGFVGIFLQSRSEFFWFFANFVDKSAKCRRINSFPVHNRCGQEWTKEWTPVAGMTGISYETWAMAMEN